MGSDMKDDSTTEQASQEVVELSYSQKYYRDNRDRIRKSKQEWYQKNKKEIIDNQKAYRRCTIENRRSYQSRYRQRHLAERRKYDREWASRTRVKDVQYKLKSNLRRRMRVLISSGDKTNSALVLLGCTIEEFKAYIESKFQEGMTWGNYSKTGWHIDHIKPCASFDLTKADEQHACFHYTNMQPLWAKDNMVKGAKWEVD
jgi:hypothetical protein